MRRSRPALLVLVVVLCGVAVWTRLLAGGPVGPVPGGWLRGAHAIASPSNWSFANREPYLLVESDAWILPYSARVWFIAYDGHLHLLLPSFFGDGLMRRLNDDPRLVVSIDGKLYEQVAVPVTDPAEIGALLAPVIRRQFAIEISGEVRRVGKSAELAVYRLEEPGAR